MLKEKTDNRMSKYFKADYKVLLIVLISGLIFNIGVVFPPIYQGKLLDSVIVGESIADVVLNALKFIAVVITIQLARYFKRLNVRRFANNLSLRLRKIMYNNLVNMPISEISAQSESEHMTRCVGDIEIFVEGARKCLTEIFDSGILMISYFVALLIYDAKTTIIAAAFIPISLLIAYAFKKNILKINILARQKDVVANNYCKDLITNTILYRNNGELFNKSRECETVLRELKTLNVKANVFENAMQPIYMIISSVGVLFIIFFGIQNVLTGIFTVGEFTAYLTMFLALTIKASKVGKLFNSFQKAKVSWARVKDRLVETSHETAEKLNVGKINLEVCNLSFNSDGKTVLENICFNAKSGEIIGVTGKVSCGKSVLGECLVGALDHYGNIKINGREINDYTFKERSEFVSYQTHDSYLFSDTIANNITFGEKTDITELLKIVSIDKDVERMSDGVETLIGSGGVRLSGGQKQRIALARALYQNNKLIVLDDPVSSVDVDTERVIVNNLRKNFKDSIIIFISHRLTSFEKFDKILFLDDDKSIFEKHSELIKKSNLYNDIFQLQSRHDNDK